MVKRLFNIDIIADTEEDKINLFLQILHKFHNLSDGLIRLVVVIVKKYYEVAGSFKDYTSDDVIYELVFSTKSRKEMAGELGMSQDVFNTSLNKLRKKGVLTKDNKINRNYIPPKGNFSLIFNFKVDV